MRFKVFVFILIISCCNTKLLSDSDDVLELISKSGYVGKAYEVETEDGYVLRLHRIIPKNSPIKRNPVFLMHGILATSADFLVTGREIALAYLLVDNGFDVWLGNARGNKFSPNHRKFSSTSKEFWNFSWHEIGFYDLPAMIDFMLKETQASKAFYVGHSQGTTSFLVMLSKRPEYNQKIIQAHLMAPSAFRKKLPRLKTIIYFFEYLESVKSFNYLDLTSFLRVQGAISRMICREDSKRLQLCLQLISSFVGNSQKEVQIDTKILPSLTQYLSPRISVMQLTHYYQNMINDNFRMFDYKEKNLIVYNSTEPPEYKLGNVAAPIYLYHASDDLYASVKGVEFLANSLPNVQKLRTIENWNHIDFIYGKNSREILYKSILETFNLSP